MENNIENLTKLNLNDVNDYKSEETHSDLVKSASNELDNRACCYSTGPDVQHIDSSRDKKETNIVIDPKSKTSANMSDLEYDFENMLSTKNINRRKLSEIHTYSTELSDDNKDGDDSEAHNIFTSASNTEYSTNISLQENRNITTSPIANLPQGSFGSVPRPPRASASFCRLDVSTDLNLPPSNWLNVDPSCLPPGLAGFDATPHYSGFSSFRMASLFLDYSSRQR